MCHGFAGLGLGRRRWVRTPVAHEAGEQVRMCQLAHPIPGGDERKADGVWGQPSEDSANAMPSMPYRAKSVSWTGKATAYTHMTYYLARNGSTITSLQSQRRGAAARAARAATLVEIRRPSAVSYLSMGIGR